MVQRIVSVMLASLPVGEVWPAWVAGYLGIQVPRYLFKPPTLKSLAAKETSRLTDCSDVLIEIYRLIATAWYSQIANKGHFV